MPEHADSVEHTDVLIVGAGVSGIGVAARLSRECPDLTLTILERRRAIGGTWDLFRFPGVRSDSDMFTFGYEMRPWDDVQVFADGPSIRDYVRDTAREFGVEHRIQYGLQVTRAEFGTGTGRWTVHARNEQAGTEREFSARFLVTCTGYYNYDQGYRPHFPGEENFGGTIVHPQFWPEDLDYHGKRMVVIGSGATAVTIVPAVAADVAQVTMLQRSPSYVVSLPAVDKISGFLRRFLPPGMVFRQARSRNIAMQQLIYAFARRCPQWARKVVLHGVRRHLGKGADISGFQPRYNPWDERLCVVPDGDLFGAIRGGKADVVTDRIEAVTETGIRLASGRELPADIIVSATGLQVQMLGGAQLVVDGEPVEINSRLTYKGVLLEGVPNAAMIFGYINASWTLKVDIAAEYVCRLLNHMCATGVDQAVVHAAAGERTSNSVLGTLDAGYVRRGNAHLPRQGSAAPWAVTNRYLRDVPVLRRDPIEDGILELSRTSSSTSGKPGATSSQTAATVAPVRPAAS